MVPVQIAGSAPTSINGETGRSDSDDTFMVGVTGSVITALLIVAFEPAQGLREGSY
jgi:hypothetical protein